MFATDGQTDRRTKATLIAPSLRAGASYNKKQHEQYSLSPLATRKPHQRLETATETDTQKRVY